MCRCWPIESHSTCELHFSGKLYNIHIHYSWTLSCGNMIFFLNVSVALITCRYTYCICKCSIFLERTPQRSYPDHGYPRVYPTRNPDKYPHPTTTRRHTTKPHPPKESPPAKSPPDTCDTSYDAVSVIRREVFIFKDTVSN